MNEIDTKWLKALKYCADNSRAMINSTEEQYPGEWVKYVPRDVETTFVKWAYFDMDGNSSHIITQKGLGQLRDLEQINARDKTFWIATIALIISAIALIKSMGFF